MKNRIKSLRQKQGKTQEELANEIGVKKLTISRWENADDVSLKQDKAQQLANIFGVSISYLLGHDDELMTFKSGAEFEEEWKKAIDRIETKERVEKKLGKSLNKAELDTKTLAKLENIKQRINQKYGTNTHGVPAYDALLAGVEENNYFIHWFDMLLDLDKMNGTDISDLLYKYFVLDRDSKRLILELIDKLPQNKIENNKD